MDICIQYWLGWVYLGPRFENPQPAIQGLAFYLYFPPLFLEVPHVFPCCLAPPLCLFVAHLVRVLYSMAFSSSLKSQFLPSENPNCAYALVADVQFMWMWLRCTLLSILCDWQFGIYHSDLKCVSVFLLYHSIRFRRSEMEGTLMSKNVTANETFSFISPLTKQVTTRLLSEGPGPCSCSLHLPSKRPLRLFAAPWAFQNSLWRPPV